MSAFDPKKRALGKGLETLLPSKSPAATQAPAVAAEPTGKPREIDVDKIDPSPYQTRQKFSEEQMEELGRSIAATGVVQPIIVRPVKDGRFELIAGERRWRASKRVGKQTIPAVVREVSNEQAMEMTIVENLQRADLNPMEQARALDRLGREFKMTQEQIALRTGKGRVVIANFVRLMKLPREIQDALETDELSFGHARALLALESEQQMLAVARKIRAQSLSVRATENFVKGVLDPERKIGKADTIEEEVIDPNVREAQETLQRALGLKVRIEDKNGKGRVVIEYAKLEQFDTLFEMLTK
ncbi:MAG: ParB/RepB/Spo0J family partition protein [Acidobacteria bacterium]|nr:ParB/RepB/Spo0J family partition protein [Acidobacteriota bacterium]